MKNLKRIAAMFAVIMILASVMVTPAFAEGCATEVNKAIVKKAYGTEDYQCSGDDNYSYSATVLGNDDNTYTIYLKERPNVDNMNVTMKDGKLNITGMGKGDANSWNNIFSRYRTVVVGVSGVGAITMIVFFIINFMKLGSSAGNPQARSQALTGVLWCGLAAAGLGAVTIIAGFFYNAV